MTNPETPATPPADAAKLAAAEVFTEGNPTAEQVEAGAKATVGALNTILAALRVLPLDTTLEHVVQSQYATDADHQALADAELAVRGAVAFREVARTLAMTPEERAAALDAS